MIRRRRTERKSRERTNDELTLQAEFYRHLQTMASLPGEQNY